MRAAPFGPILVASLCSGCAVAPVEVADDTGPTADPTAGSDEPAECAAFPTGFEVSTCVVSTAPGWFDEAGSSYDVSLTGTVVDVGADVTAPAGSSNPWATGTCEAPTLAVQLLDEAGETWTVALYFDGLTPPVDIGVPGETLELRATYRADFAVTEILALHRAGELLFAFEQSGGLTAEERAGISIGTEEGCVWDRYEYDHVVFTGESEAVSLQQGGSATLASAGSSWQVAVPNAFWWLDCYDGCGNISWVIWPAETNR